LNTAEIADMSELVELLPAPEPLV